MKVLNLLFDKEWKIKTLLCILSFGIYFIYFHNVFLNLNTVMCGVNSDSIKNYFTYAYQITNSSTCLNFEGMNFPYGEHPVFTDCQPLVCFILRFLPFTHAYLIGILHALMFSSFVFSPLILYKIFRTQEIGILFSFLISISITLLSPQFYKINGGHYALAYGIIIPINILLLIKYSGKPQLQNTFKLFAFNSGLFFIHPYLGIGTSFLTLLTIFFLRIKDVSVKKIIDLSITSIFPIILFKIFMLITDKHINRTTEPYGSEVLIENPDSLLAPDYGPFQSLLNSIFSHKTIHYEGHSYIGFSVIISTIIILLSVPFFIKKIRINRIVISLFCASLILLFISFGWHIKLLDKLNVSSNTVLQFRASCRFAWFFYYIIAVFISILVHQLIRQIKKEQTKKIILNLFPLLFFISNMVEANAYFQKDKSLYWTHRNLFNYRQLTAGEIRIIDKIKNGNYQALVTFPLFYAGSEMYDRLGSDYEAQLSFFYSYHTKLPIMGTWLSRTSMSETENALQLLNTYKLNRDALKLLNGNNFLVVRTKTDLLPIEKRLMPYIKIFDTLSDVSFGTLKQKDIYNWNKENELIKIKDTVLQEKNLIYIPYQNRKPFINSKFKDNSFITKIDSNKIDTGNYVVSFRYFYSKKTYKSLACCLLVTKRTASEYKWQYYLPISILSGFYNSYAMVERFIKIEKNSEYELYIMGESNSEYKISNFMLRQEFLQTLVVKSNNDSLVNNYAR